MNVPNIIRRTKVPALQAHNVTLPNCPITHKNQKKEDNIYDENHAQNFSESMHPPTPKS